LSNLAPEYRRWARRSGIEDPAGFENSIMGVHELVWPEDRIDHIAHHGVTPVKSMPGSGRLEV
jgi:hypothetical protein